MRERENNQIQDFKHGAQAKMHAGEIDIDVSLVRRLLRSSSRTWQQYSLTAVRSTGTVNAIFRLGDALCVRLPR